MARSRWYPFILVGLLFGFWGLVGVNRLGIQFLFPFIVKDFHLNLTQVSLLVSGTSNPQPGLLPLLQAGY